MQTKSTLLIVLLSLLLVALAACAPAAEEPPAATAVPVEDGPTPAPQETPALDPAIRPEDPEEKLRTTAAVNDLAERLGVDRAQIEVVAYEPITWNDGSLGCPQPDQMYTQALVDGYLIQLRVDGQTYNYHGANGEDPFLCER